MHVLARIGYTLAGLALFTPAFAQAGMPAFGPSNKPKAATKAPNRLCGECQRAKLLFDKGVAVSPPPALPPRDPRPRRKLLALRTSRDGAFRTADPVALVAVRTRDDEWRHGLRGTRPCGRGG